MKEEQKTEGRGRRSEVDRMTKRELKQRLMVSEGEKRARELEALPPNAMVEFRTDAGVPMKTRISQKPWQLGHGQWVVGLLGITGGFDVMRVQPAPSGGALSGKESGK